MVYFNNYFVIIGIILLIPQISCIEKSNSIWVNVFVHGTIAPPLAILSPFAVINDCVEGSLFEQACSFMRNSCLCYQDQLIFDLGMHKVEPNFLIDQDCDYFCAAPIILEAFRLIDNACISTKSQDVFYLFGWNGLLSQKVRRNAAFDLYKELVVLFNFYKKQGITPKFRILAHSHGGNVALNLAGINYQFVASESEADRFYSNFEVAPYVKFNFAELNIDEASLFGSNEKKSLFIDELVMLGTPFQEETALFASSPIFGRVYNLYSDSDLIQSMDSFSTRGRQSNQRIDFLPLNWRVGQFSESKKSFFKNFYQIKITVNLPENSKFKKIRRKRSINLFKVLTGFRQDLDPTHKELWYLVANRLRDCDYIKPVPAVCFSSIITRLIESYNNYVDESRDYIFEISKLEDKVVFQLKGTGDQVALPSIEVNYDLIEKVRRILILCSIKNSKYPASGLADNLAKIAQMFNL